jgi:hypothetical protein
MFEITGDDIAALSDDDLRSLVARLCEAEVRRQGLPASSVTWGGDQNAPDGGVDVRVNAPKKEQIQGFIPRHTTGFQVKKPDLSRAGILKEMRPGGKVRPVICTLAQQSGAYIIVSSNGSVSDSALVKRRQAMIDAVKGTEGAASLALDFYDRGRIATWVRDHPGLIPWVRQKIGKSISGWRPYGAWANPAEDEKAPYLLDDKLRIYTGKKAKAGVLPAAEGLGRIRDVLREPRKAVRIVGLSGVGKTRFVQAVFDGRVGERSLTPSLAIYTNMADDPNPQPVGLVSDLIASGTRTILVVDNCPPDLHRRLSETCRVPSSLLSLVTIEYDIRDDDPEETDVFRLEPSSVELIEKLVRGRFTNLSQVDARTIAEFSGGNARVAIALANTIGKNETIAGLTDEDLFGRLFQQRHAHDASLLLIGEACSLVYSFQGEAISGDEAELPVFAAMIGKSVDEVFHGVAELQSRELVQQRGVWRAVLPHAIANRLAEMALKNIPQERINAQLVDGASARLLKSFSRRLGYLHDNKSVLHLVEQWLERGGLLADLANLNDLGIAMLENVAPVAPEAVVTAIERVTPEALSHRDRFVKIVRSIAFDAKLFGRCAELLIQFGETRNDDGGGRNIDDHLTSLFFIVLSGTHASMEQRLEVVEALLRSDSAYRRAVGVSALRNALEALHFSSAFSFEFGARPRDYGSWPKTDADLQHWYTSAIRLVETLVWSGLPIASEVRNAFASQFRGLWNRPLIRGELDRVCRSLLKAGFWREGWVAVRETLRYDGKGMPKAAKAALLGLERTLAPKNLLQKVRGVVLSSRAHGIDLDDVEDDARIMAGLARMDALAVALGKDTAKAPVVLKELLPELVSGQGRLWMFGRGLAAGADDPQALWQLLAAEFAAAREAVRNTQVFRGMLEGLSQQDPKFADQLLDEAVDKEPLAAWVPELQTAVTIGKPGADRLQKSLALGKAPVLRFRVLAWGRASDPIPALDLKALILAIASKPDGFDVAAEILRMRFFSDRQEKKPLDPALIEAGRELLRALEFSKHQQNEDHRIGSLIKLCLTGAEGAKVFETVCGNFKRALAKREVFARNHDRLLQSLFKAQPLAALDAFLGGSDAKRGCQAILDVSHHHANPLDAVPINDLIAWCDRAPADRYPLMARVITLYKSKEDEPPLEWHPGALALLEKAPDHVAVLNQFVRRFRPMSWSGSRAAAMETRLPLLRALEAHADPAIAALAKADGTRLESEIERERERETRDDRASDERFE